MNVITDWEARHAFEFEQSLDGPSGPRGLTGSTGPTGPTGPTGAGATAAIANRAGRCSRIDGSHRAERPEWTVRSLWPDRTHWANRCWSHGRDVQQRDWACWHDGANRADWPNGSQQPGMMEPRGQLARRRHGSDWAYWLGRRDSTRRGRDRQVRSARPVRLARDRLDLLAERFDWTHWRRADWFNRRAWSDRCRANRGHGSNWAYWLRADWFKWAYLDRPVPGQQEPLVRLGLPARTVRLDPLAQGRLVQPAVLVRPVPGRQAQLDPRARQAPQGRLEPQVRLGPVQREQQGRLDRLAQLDLRA